MSYEYLVSNFDDLTKKKSIINNPTNCENKNVKVKEYSPSLNQGIQFNQFQNAKTTTLEEDANQLSSKEGFQGLSANGNGLTMQTKKVINENDYTSQQQTLAI